MARCVVIGGNGFLGSHVVDALAAGGHEVTAFDRFGDEPEMFTARGVRALSGNFLSRPDLAEAVRGQEVVLHFLSTTDPATADNDPMLDVRTNLASSIELFEVCTQSGVSRVLFASTGGAIYGDQDRQVFDEDAPTNPVSPYAIGKLAIEGYLRYFERKHGLAHTVVRISNPYGPRQNPRKRQGVIPIFLRAIARGEPITVLGDGGMIRDYVYVADVADMVAALVSRPGRHALYNLGSGRGVSVNGLVETIRSVTGRSIEVRHLPQPPTYVDHVVLDTGRFAAEFGDLAPTSLEAGIGLTWDDVLAAGGV